MARQETFRPLARTLLVVFFLAAVVGFIGSSGAHGSVVPLQTTSPTPTTSPTATCVVPLPTPAPSPICTYPPPPSSEPSPTADPNSSPTPEPEPSESPKPPKGGDGSVKEKPTEVLLGYDGKKDSFFGLVEAVESCLTDRDVSIHKVREGRDAYIGSAETDDRGRFSVERKVAKGDFYALVSSVAVGGYGKAVECGEGESKVIRVKP